VSVVNNASVSLTIDKGAPVCLVPSCTRYSPMTAWSRNTPTPSSSC
jgi:hypothetical protein